nr:hypothetical protein [uncultured Campylobacter sp.]
MGFAVAVKIRLQDFIAIFALRAAALAVECRSGSVQANFRLVFLLRNPLDQGDSRRKTAKSSLVRRWAVQAVSVKKS